VSLSLITPHKWKIKTIYLFIGICIWGLVGAPLLAYLMTLSFYSGLWLWLIGRN